MFSASDKSPLSPLIITFGKCFSAVLSEVLLMMPFGILQNHKNGLTCLSGLRPKNSIFWYNFLTLWYIASVGLEYEEVV